MVIEEFLGFAAPEKNVGSLFARQLSIFSLKWNFNRNVNTKEDQLQTSDRRPIPVSLRFLGAVEISNDVEGCNYQIWTKMQLVHIVRHINAFLMNITKGAIPKDSKDYHRS